MSIAVQRAGDRSYRVERDGEYLTSLSFREVQALVACRLGRARAALRRRYGQFYCDEHVEPECDVYGVGYGTLSHLQHPWPPDRALIASPDEPGPLPLTALGDQVLDAILALSGASLATPVLPPP